MKVETAVNRAVAVVLVVVGILISKTATAASSTLDAGANQRVKAVFGAESVDVKVMAIAKGTGSANRNEVPKLVWSVVGLSQSCIRWPDSNPATITLPAPPSGEKAYRVNVRSTYSGIVKTDSLTVTVCAADPPQIKALAGPDFPLYRVNPGETKGQLRGTYTTPIPLPAGAQTIVNWKFVNGPASGVKILDDTSFETPIFLPAADGLYLFRMTVSVVWRGQTVVSSSDLVSVNLKRPPAMNRVVTELQNQFDQNGFFVNQVYYAKNNCGFRIRAKIEVRYTSGRVLPVTQILNPYQSVMIAKDGVFEKFINASVTNESQYLD